MAKSSTLQAKVDTVLKANVENILAQIGLTTSDAVNLFFKQVELNRGLPFELKIPRYNDETIEAIREAEQILKDPNSISFNSVEELMADLNS